MLISKTVIVMPKSRINYYKLKGYDVSTIKNKNDTIRVNTFDLPIHSNIYVEVQCDYCKESFYTTYNNYNRGRKIIQKDSCKKCKNKKTKEINLLKYGTNSLKEISKIRGFKLGRKSHDGQQVYNDFIKAGLSPQFKPEDYIDMHQKLPYICDKHKNKGILYLTYNNFKNRNAHCKYCDIEHSQDYKRYTYDFCLEEFAKNDYTLLEKEYHDCDIPLKFICNKHKNKGVQYVTLYNLLHFNNNCQFCKNELKSNENHWHWQGGISKISEYLRNKIKNWKMDSLKSTNYMCTLTHIPGKLEIHHLHSFSDIVQETMILLNLPVYETINKYTDNELNLIIDKCLELHYKYGLGVPLLPIVHSLFHHEYGQDGSTTKEDFQEFTKRFNNHEFDNILKINKRR